ncbi:MAG: hypothetical protein ATN34_00175 [Epulopiscium sp. Nele67-Bin002]|nr:MAG: hypothetical protein ATN34_00175 [Epulopiscium sp. Nele67-Bin002]
MPLTMINNKVMVPVRFIAEQMNCDVAWNNVERSVSISTNSLYTVATASSIDNSAYSNNAYMNYINNTTYDKDSAYSYANLTTPSIIDTTTYESQLFLSSSANLSYDNWSNSLTFNLAGEINTSKITVIDDYREKMITIDLGGDYSHLYPSTMKTISDDDAVSSIETVTTNGTTKFIITENTIYTYDMTTIDNNVKITLLRPQEKYDKIVMLDSGHGGIDSGAINDAGLMEKDVNMTQTLEIKRLLEAESDIKVYMTREDDVYSTLNERTALANEIEADLFISIHNNASEYSSAHGAEVFYFPNDYDVTGQQLAEEMLERIVNYTGMYDRGAKEATTYIVLKTSAMPALLVEAGFLTNSSDAAKLATSSFTQTYARAVVETIIDFFN